LTNPSPKINSITPTARDTLPIAPLIPVTQRICEICGLALSYWLGSEFDIAVFSRAPADDGATIENHIFHEFDAMTNTGLHVKHGFEWDSAKEYHVGTGEMSNLKIITNLLTFYNAVFFDDMFAQRSQIYYHNVLPTEVPPKIRIWRGQTEARKYLQADVQIFKLQEYRRDSDDTFKKVVKAKLPG
jgi:hypothetical protein